MPDDEYSIEQIMCQSGVFRIPYEKVITSNYAKKRGWTEPNGYPEHKEGWFGQKINGEPLISGEDTAPLILKQMKGLLECKP